MTVAATATQHRAHTVVDSPIGPLTLVAADGRLAAIHMEDERHPGDPATFGGRDPDAPVLAETARQLSAYFAGELTSFELPLAEVGTPFQRRVWAALQKIPYGETASYGEIAEQIGQPTASRAVGMANGRNPIPIVVPCHRVIGASGSLTGYGGGLDRKERLLDHEQHARSQG